MALHPALVRGVVEELVPLAPTVLLEAMSEDTLVLASPEAPTTLLEEARACTEHLERDLYDDPADRLRYAAEVPLDVAPLGQFELQMVSADFFELRDAPTLGGALGDAHAAYQRGLAFEQLGRTDRAVEAFTKSLRIDASDGEVSFALGRNLHALGEFERAIPLLRQAESEYPDRAEVANALGMSLYQAGEVDEAADAFERAVALDPTESAFYVNLGRSYLDEEKLDAAEKALETALHLRPDSADAHASLALVCHKAGDNTRALHHAREALAEEPENPVMRLLLRTLDGPAR
ncbi:MAG: tetratricopeptide repeat protein [Myxococcota bacterium]